MPENTPDQIYSNPSESDALRQALLRPIQHQLAKQGIYLSPEASLTLLELQIEYDAERWLQQDLAEHGIEVSPDEAVAIHGLRLIHRIMEGADISDPSEAP